MEYIYNLGANKTNSQGSLPPPFSTTSPAPNSSETQTNSGIAGQEAVNDCAMMFFSNPSQPADGTSLEHIPESAMGSPLEVKSRVDNSALFTFPVSFRSAARLPSAAFASSEIASAIPSSSTAASGASRLTEILPGKVNKADNSIDQLKNTRLQQTTTVLHRQRINNPSILQGSQFSENTHLNNSQPRCVITSKQELSVSEQEFHVYRFNKNSDGRVIQKLIGYEPMEQQKQRFLLIINLKVTLEEKRRQISLLISNENEYKFYSSLLISDAIETSFFRVDRRQIKMIEILINCSEFIEYISHVISINKTKAVVKPNDNLYLNDLNIIADQILNVINGGEVYTKDLFSNVEVVLELLNISHNSDCSWAFLYKTINTIKCELPSLYSQDQRRGDQLPMSRIHQTSSENAGHVGHSGSANRSILSLNQKFTTDALELENTQTFFDYRTSTLHQITGDGINPTKARKYQFLENNLISFLNKMLEKKSLNELYRDSPIRWAGGECFIYSKLLVFDIPDGEQSVPFIEILLYCPVFFEFLKFLCTMDFHNQPHTKSSMKNIQIVVKYLIKVMENNKNYSSTFYDRVEIICEFLDSKNSPLRPVQNLRNTLQKWKSQLQRTPQLESEAPLKARPVASSQPLYVSPPTASYQPPLKAVPAQSNLGIGQTVVAKNPIVDSDNRKKAYDKFIKFIKANPIRKRNFLIAMQKNGGDYCVYLNNPDFDKDFIKDLKRIIPNKVHEKVPYKEVFLHFGIRINSKHSSSDIKEIRYLFKKVNAINNESSLN